MKSIVWIAAFATMAAGSAYAHQVYEPVVPRGLPESRVAPSAPLPPAAQPHGGK